MFWAVAPVGAIVSVKLFPGVRIDFCRTPVLLAGMKGAILKPHPVAEEGNLASVVRILDKRKI